MKALRGIVKAIFIAFCVCAWFLVVFAACEFYEQRREPRLIEKSDKLMLTLFGPLMDRDEQLANTVPAPPPPAWAPTNPEPLEAILPLDEAGRAQFAASRQELILLCGDDAVIRSVYSCPNRDELRALGEKAKVGESVATLLPPREGQDAVTAIAEAGRIDISVFREYSLSIPGAADPYACAMSAKHSPGPTSPNRIVLVSFHDSKYLQLNKKYRIHIYLNSKYTPLYPQFKTSEFWTNNHGYRDDDVETPKPTGVYRILCVGGSTTVEGPRNDLTYPRFLQNRLREYFNTQKIEVINCGVDAASTTVEKDCISDYIALEPDLVIDYAFANDALTVFNVSSQNESPVKRALKRSKFLYAVAPRLLLPSEDRVLEAIRKITIENERAVNNAIRKIGGEMALCSPAFPDFQNIPRNEAHLYDNRYCHVHWGQGMDRPQYSFLASTYAKAAREFCEKEGAIYLPVQENLKGGVNLFVDIAHLRVPGIQKKADVIFELLKGHIAVKLKEKGITATAGASSSP
jgi:hypothetical protein